MSKQDCLIIFTRKPEKGKVKTRLAKGVGEDKALEIYEHLLKHSAKVVIQTDVTLQVWYTENIENNDIWDDNVFEKRVQTEGDLGFKMQQAFHHNFKQGYQKVIIIGTDLLDIDTKNIEEAFQLLDQNEVVIGPAKDGGYYLLGMTHFIPSLFENIDWSTEYVFKQTLERINDKSLALLEKKNDIDYVEDALEHDVFKKIING